MKTLPLTPLLLASLLLCATGYAQDSRPAGENEFRRVHRPGAVDIDAVYNLAGLTIPKEQIHTLLPRDAIPALTDPKTEPADQVRWLPGNARIIEIVVGDDVLGVPLRILDWHEIVNVTVGGEPIAATYCPLCDSATVFSRKVDDTSSGRTAVLEFGVSGALYNSNVLMYDKRDKGLWSQLGMRAVSGPLAGTALEMLPIRLVTFAAFREAHPGAKIVSRDTGHRRDYARSPYQEYFKDDSLMVPVAGVGDALPRKTLGVGIAGGDGEDAWAWFVPVQRIGDGRTLDTPAGKVTLGRNEAGVYTQAAPAGVRTAQTFYYAWSAFYPQTRIVREAAADAAPGLPVGHAAPAVAVTAVDGSTVSLASLYESGPIVLTFYRGGWCPICTRALSAWGSRLGALREAGGRLVALTPERPELADATRATAGADYEVYSDASHAAAKAFRVHFVVDDATRAQYRRYGLKVAESNVSGTWELPAPATFVIDQHGIIRYAFADWDYQKRADPDEVIAAVRALKGGQ